MCKRNLRQSVLFELPPKMKSQGEFSWFRWPNPVEIHPAKPSMKGEATDAPKSEPWEPLSWLPVYFQNPEFLDVYFYLVCGRLKVQLVGICRATQTPRRLAVWCAAVQGTLVCPSRSLWTRPVPIRPDEKGLGQRSPSGVVV